MWKKTQELKDQGKSADYKIDMDGLLTLRKIIFIPNRMELKEMILDEFHHSNCSGHPGYQNMLTAMKKDYFWPGIRKDIAEYVNRCIECH